MGRGEERAKLVRALTGIPARAGIPTLVLLTKVDDYDPHVIGHDIKHAFHSVRLRAVITVRSPLLARPS